VCLRIGPRHHDIVENIIVNNMAVEWHSEMPYLEMTFIKATKIKCNLQNIRHTFFGAANGI